MGLKKTFWWSIWDGETISFFYKSEQWVFMYQISWVSVTAGQYRIVDGQGHFLLKNVWTRGDTERLICRLFFLKGLSLKSATIRAGRLPIFNFFSDMSHALIWFHLMSVHSRKNGVFEYAVFCFLYGRLFSFSLSYVKGKKADCHSLTFFY